MVQVSLSASSDYCPSASGGLEHCGADGSVCATHVHGAGRRYLTLALRAAEDSWRRLDLTSAQLKALIVLASRDELTVGGLAGLLAMSRPSGSILVEQLVQGGLVTRTDDPTDRRRATVRLAAEGYALLARLFAVEEMTIEEGVASIEPDKLARVVAGLDVLEGCLIKSYRARGGGCGPATAADSSDVGAIVASVAR